MNRKGVPSEPRGPCPDSQETSPLLNAYSHVPSHTENAVDGAALRRNEQEGKNVVHRSSLHVPIEYSMAGDSNGETYDNVPKDKRQLGQVTT